MVNLAIIVICAICKLIGEICWHNAQRFILPIVFAFGLSINSHCWWLGLTCLPMIGPLTLGYKDFGPSDGFDRGMWLFLICAVAGLGSVITGHLFWPWYVLYCIIAGIWGATTRNLWNVIIAPISGAWIASLLLIIHS